MQWLEAQQRTWLATLFRTGPLSEGMTVYRRNFLGIHGAALEQTYPLTQRLLGNERFRLFTQMMLRHYPIRSGDLNDYGAELPLLLAEAATELPACASDLALFEWESFVCLNSATPQPRQLVDAVSAQTLARQSVRLAPCTRMLDLTYPVHRLMDPPDAGLTKERCRVLLYRMGTDVLWRELSSASAAFVATLSWRERLLPAVESALTFDPAFELREWLAWLLTQQLLITGNEA